VARASSSWRVGREEAAGSSLTAPVATVRKHGGAALVAVAVFVLALAEGGFDPQIRASLAIALWWAVIVGLFVRAWPGSHPPRAAIFAAGCLAGIAVLSALSLLWADDAGRAFGDLLTPVTYLGLFAFVVLASTRGSGRTWLSGLAAGLAAVCVAALISRVEPGLLGLADRELAEDLPLAVDRLSYPIGYWNGLAGCAAIAVGLLAWIGTVGRSQLVRALGAGLLPAAALVIFLTQSRGGAFAALASLVVLFALGRGRPALSGTLVLGAAGALVLCLLAEARPAFRSAAADAAAEPQGLEMGLAILAVVAIVVGVRFLLDPWLGRAELPVPSISRRMALGGAAALACAAVAVAIAAGLPEQFADAGAYSGTEEDRLSLQGSGRSQFWTAALEAYGSEPLGGIGAGNFDLYWNANNTLPAVIQHAHSLPLEMLAELGPLGLLLVLAFFAAAAVAGVARSSEVQGDIAAAGVAVLTAGALTAAIEWTWDIPGVFAPVVLAAAVLTGPATLRPPVPRAIGAPSPSGWLRRFTLTTPRERFGLGVATMLIGFASIWIAAVTLLTGIQLTDSRDAADVGELERAADAARDAETIQPWAAAPRLQLAQVEELRGNYDAARAAVAEARERSPGDWRTWFVTARIEDAAGREAESEAALERAAEISPTPLPALRSPN
jgi:tetratricopeptide (TPR) repeat protein